MLKSKLLHYWKVCNISHFRLGYDILQARPSSHESRVLVRPAMPVKMTELHYSQWSKQSVAQWRKSNDYPNMREIE
jgi:hypothetical protein